MLTREKIDEIVSTYYGTLDGNTIMYRVDELGDYSPSFTIYNMDNAATDIGHFALYDVDVLRAFEKTRGPAEKWPNDTWELYEICKAEIEEFWKDLAINLLIADKE